MLSVIPVGADVTVGGNVAAVVQQIIIAANGHVQYQCAWWDSGSRKCEWLHANEVEYADSRTQVKFQ